jgi:hypothetical protein
MEWDNAHQVFQLRVPIRDISLQSDGAVHELIEGCLGVNQCQVQLSIKAVTRWDDL